MSNEADNYVHRAGSVFVFGNRPMSPKELEDHLERAEENEKVAARLKWLPVYC